MNCPACMLTFLLLILDEEWAVSSGKVVPVILELSCHQFSHFVASPRWRMSKINKQGRPTNLWIVLPKCFPFLLLFLDEEWLGSSSKVVPLIYELSVHQFSHFFASPTWWMNKIIKKGRTVIFEFFHDPLLFSVAQGIFWLSSERLSSSTLHLIEGVEGNLVLCSLATKVLSCIEPSVRIVTKFSKVGPLLTFSMSLL